MSCPKCGGVEWKLASLLHAEGKRVVSTSSIGVGTAVAANSGPVLVTGHTSGTEQSVLSKRLEPPQTPVKPWRAAKSFGCALIGLPILLVMGGALSKQQGVVEFAIVATLAGMVLSLPFFLFAKLTPGVEGKLQAQYENAVQEHRKALENYSRTKVCMRCGEVYLEDNQTEAAARAAKPQPSSVASETAAPESQPTKRCPFCAETILLEAVLCKHCKSKLA